MTIDKTTAADREVPEALASAIRADLRPVRPVFPAWVRTGIPWILAAIAGVVFVVIHGLRPDLPDIPPSLFTMQTLARVVVGLVLIAIAIRESVPSAGVTNPARAVGLAAAIVLLVLLPFGFSRAMDAPVTAFNLAELLCYRRGLMIASLAFVAVVILLLRAWPLRAVTAFSAAGLGTGLLADAALFSACGATGMTHLLFAHSTAVATLGVLGGLIGLGVARLRRIG